MEPKVAPDVAFVLRGGGRWGAVQVGMLQALVESGIAPRLIVGTSIGAIDGAVFAAKPTGPGVARLRRLWDEVAEAGLGGVVLGSGRQSGPAATWTVFE